jgi:hypothetical protein
LGRYLTVDYERSKFYISQTAFQQGATEHIITISPPNSTRTAVPEPSPSHSLPTAAIVGIAVGCIILGVVGMLALLFLLKKRPFAKPKEDTKPSEEAPIEMIEYNFEGKPELGDTALPPKPPTEMAAVAVEYYPPDKDARELESPRPNVVYEMDGGMPGVQELHAVESSSHSPRSPESQLSRLSGTVSPVSDRDERIVSGMSESTL